jgi:hypothetical protein
MTNMLPKTIHITKAGVVCSLLLLVSAGAALFFTTAPFELKHQRRSAVECSDGFGLPLAIVGTSATVRPHVPISWSPGVPLESPAPPRSPLPTLATSNRRDTTRVLTSLHQLGVRVQV